MSGVETPLRKSLAARGLFGFGLQVVLRLRGLLLVPILTRVLTPAELGVISLGNALTSGLSPVLLLGMHTGLALQMAHLQGAAVRPALLTVFSFSTVFAAVTTVLVLAAISTGMFGAAVAPLLPVLAPVGLYAVGLTLREIFTAFPQVRQRLRFIGWNSLLMDFGGALAAIALVLLGFGAYGALMGVAIMTLLGAVIALAYSLKIAEGPWKAETSFLTTTLRTSLPVVPLALGLWTLQSSDYFFVSHYGGPADVALYGLAYNLASPTLMVMAAMNLTYLPTCVEILRQGRAPFASFMDDSTRYFTVGGIAAVACSAAAGPGVTAWLAGPTYTESGRLLPWIVAAYVFYSLSQLQQFIPAAMTKDMSGSARAHAWAALINIVANALLVPRFGLWGAAWATTGSYALAFLLLYRSVHGLLPELRFASNAPRAAVLAALATALGVWLQTWALGVVLSLLCGALTLAATVALSAGLGLLTYEDAKRLARQARLEVPERTSP